MALQSMPSGLVLVCNSTQIEHSVKITILFVKNESYYP